MNIQKDRVIGQDGKTCYTPFLGKMDDTVYRAAERVLQELGWEWSEDDNAYILKLDLGVVKLTEVLSVPKETEAEYAGWYWKFFCHTVSAATTCNGKDVAPGQIHDMLNKYIDELEDVEYSPEMDVYTPDSRKCFVRQEIHVDRWKPDLCVKTCPSLCGGTCTYFHTRLKYEPMTMADNYDVAYRRCTACVSAEEI
ncbi:MAG: hypothetical protein Q4D38_00255 [Planctomycetia bacterium]|nr:hypothetical protein [Planctomycetia bacterium]